MRSIQDVHSIKAYTKLGLRVYDPLIMCGLLRHVWGCEPRDLVEHYREHVTPHHADIGVGTGYCLDRCGLTSDRARLVLIDLNPNCLEYTARRVARYRPRTYVRDVLQPLESIAEAPFDSIALGGILHCLAGDLREKSRVLDTAATLGRRGTKLFGYTLVCDGIPLNARRRLAHRVLNRWRVVDNSNDRSSDLHRELSLRFKDCRVESIGCMALFSAVIP